LKREERHGSGIPVIARCPTFFPSLMRCTLCDVRDSHHIRCWERKVSYGLDIAVVAAAVAAAIIHDVDNDDNDDDYYYANDSCSNCMRCGENIGRIRKRTIRGIIQSVHYTKCLHSVCISQVIRKYRDNPIPIYTDSVIYSIFDYLCRFGMVSETMYLNAFSPYCCQCMQSFISARYCTNCNNINAKNRVNNVHSVLY
jgi:hypothetical protein